MTTRAQRKRREIAAKHGKQFALERAVLSAARALAGSVKKHGIHFTVLSANQSWGRFLKAEHALHDFHAAKQRDKG